MLTQNEAMKVQLGLFVLALRILVKKRQDYSGHEDPFGNLRLSEGLGVDPIVGALIRESDKNSRIAQLVDSDTAGVGGAVGESLLDTFADKVNYTCIEAGLYAERDGEFKSYLIAESENIRNVIQSLYGSMADDEVLVDKCLGDPWNYCDVGIE